MSKELFEAVPQAAVEKLILQVKYLLEKNPLTEMYTFPIEEPLKQYANYDKSDWAVNLLEEELNPFEMTLKLREKMRAELEGKKFDEGDTKTEEGTKTSQIAKWIVKEWGGIKTGKDENLKASILLAEKQHEDILKAEKEKKGCNKKFKLERIASWSKFMAFKYPQQYAIYDARVIYSLNWLLLKTKTGNAQKKKEVGEEGELKFFPFLDGQNSVMGLLNYNIHLLLSHYHEDTLLDALKKDIKNRNDTEGNKSSLRSNLEKGLFIPKQAAYSEYCDLLKKLAEAIYPDTDTHRLTKIEMILFSIADKEAIASDVMRLLTGKSLQCTPPAT